ncbi:MAG: glycosyltransferase [Deltaproteobacteria bacterium]|nr:glycosyltransferase [Deltaproteobacteria bacterium]
MKRGRKRILWVTFHFPPRQSGGVFRPIKIYKYLDKRRFEVDFLTLSLVSKYRRAIRDDTLLAEVSPKPRVYRLPSIEFDDVLRGIFDIARRKRARGNGEEGNSSKRRPLSNDTGLRFLRASLRKLYRMLIMTFYFPDHLVVWGSLASFKALWLHLRNRYDVIYTTSNPPSGHLPGLLLRLCGAKWVADFRDGGSLWNKQVLGYVKNKVREQVDFNYQRYVLSRADYVITQSELLKKDFSRVFSLNHSRIKTIPNGYDEDDFVRQRGQELPFQKRAKEIHILHVGSWVLNEEEVTKIQNNLNSLQRGLKEKGHAMYVHALGNDLFGGDRKKAVRFNYLFHGVIPHSILLPYLAAADCYLLCASVGKLVEGARGVLAGKLWEYLRGGKPILLFGPRDEAWNIIEDAGVGLYLGELDSDETVSVDELFSLVTKVKSVRSEVSQHSWESRARALQQVFLEVLEYKPTD